MRGQSAVEYLIIFSAVLVIFAVATLWQMINPAQEAGRDTLYLSQARSAADTIAWAVNSVYANGQGAVKSVSFTMDHSWSLYLENAGGEENVRISIKTSERVENVRSNLRYGFNANLQNLSTGTYTVIVEWPDNQENLVKDNYKIYIYINPLKES
ncbi:MAG: hypothetical protein ACE5OT_00475 [Candidatus Hadarchaeaceae archaeon]